MFPAVKSSAFGSGAKTEGEKASGWKNYPFIILYSSMEVFLCLTWTQFSKTWMTGIDFSHHRSYNNEYFDVSLLC